MKRILAVICVVAFAFSLTACCSLKEVRKLQDESKQFSANAKRQQPKLMMQQ